MRLIVIRHPNGSAEERPLEAELTIGRSDGNDLMLTEGGVSRKHARLVLAGDRVKVEDIGSANGTFIDGERIKGQTELVAGATLAIGEYQLQVKAAPPRGSGGAKPEVRRTKVVKALSSGKSALARADPSGEPVEQPTLRGLTGPWLNKLYPLSGLVTLGREPASGIFLQDDSVSRRHAELEMTDEGVVVRDLGSANGTAVNGTAINDEVLLQTGDLLQFGVIELVLEGPQSEALAPVPRGSRRALARPEAADDSARVRKGPVLILAGLLLLGVGGAAVAKLLLQKPEPAKLLGQKVQPAVELDPQAALSEYLAECRSFSSPELKEPDWQRAEAACSKALDLDPIHPEALSLRRKIREEQECATNYTRGERELLRRDERKALELFGKIAPGCSYFVKAKSKVRQAIDGVMKAAARDCKSYVGNAKWNQVLASCEQYMKLACQNMREGELRPPLNHKLVLSSGRLGKREWRPKDPHYLGLLRAREKVSPDAPPWQCPPMAILRKEQGPPDPHDDVKKVFAERFPEKALADAMLFYFDGRAGEANNLLQRVREKQEKASYHALADELRKDITLVQQLFNEGQGYLQGADPEKAAPPFTEALTVDQQLMKDLAEKTPSFFRRNISIDMGSRSFERGKEWAERGDVRRACRLWKLGYSFYKGNVDLLQALSNTCIQRAAAAFEGAKGCDDLKVVEDFAVEGDGLLPKVAAKKTEMGCP